MLYQLLNWYNIVDLVYYEFQSFFVFNTISQGRNLSVEKISSWRYLALRRNLQIW